MLKEAAMKSLFVVVLSCIVLCEYVKPLQSIHIGPYDASAKVGISYEKYLPLSPRDELATANAIHFAEWSRSVFPTGLGPHVPPLDPYIKRSIEPFEVKGKLLSGIVHLSNLVKIGAQKFHLNELTVRLNGTRVDFNVSIPELLVDVDFLTNLTFDNAQYDLTGHINLTIVGVNIVGDVSAAVAGMLPPVHFTVIGMHLDLHADDVVADVKNLATRKYLRQSPEIMRDVVDEIKDTIAMVLVKSASRQVDDILTQFTLDQVMSMLLGAQV